MSTTNKGHWTEREDAMLASMRRAGHSIAEIAACVNRSQESCKSRVKRLRAGRDPLPQQAKARRERFIERDLAYRPPEPRYPSVWHYATGATYDR